MTHIQVVRIKKLTGKNIIEVAARHNHREIASERGADSHIDTERTGLNRVLRGDGTAASVANMAQALLDNAGVKTLRKDSVRALEIIFSLPPVSPIDHECFFRDALDWADEYFQAPVISAVIHYDEAAPHCHVLVLPLVRGRMIGSDLMGNRTRLQTLQSDFHAKVGQRHGLTRQQAQKRLNASVRQSATVMVLNAIQENPDILRKPSVRQALHDAIANSPESLLLALDLEMPKPKIKGTFVGIMTKPTKPERKHKPIGFGKLKPIGFDDVSTPEKEQTLSCVGFGESAPPISPTINPNKPSSPAPIADTLTVKEPNTDNIADDWTRQRDDEVAAEQWEDGNAHKPPAKVSSKRQVVESVRAALGGIGAAPRGIQHQPVRRVMRC